MIFNQKGFSLIEVLITFIMLIIGLMGQIKLQSYMERQADYAENSIKAIHLAESQLELFSAHIISDPNTLLPCQDQSVFLNFDCIVSGEKFIDDFRLIWTVDNLVSGDLKAINIEVHWKNRWQPQSLTLMTMISRYGYGGL